LLYVGLSPLQETECSDFILLLHINFFLYPIYKLIRWKKYMEVGPANEQKLAPQNKTLLLWEKG
jgi:hypothetical protein